ncbi:MAG: HAD hydrolase family protein [Bacteroidota bacterium]
MSYLAKNLRYIRQQRAKNMAEFSEVLGIYEESLRRFEREKAEPDMDTLVTISNTLELPIDDLLKKDLELIAVKASSRKLRLLLLDVDGTLTDGGMYYTEKGDQMKRFYVKDGMALVRAMKHHQLQVGLISSSSTQELIKARAAALGIQRVHAGKGSKLQLAESWCQELGIKLEQVAFIGDDLNDLNLLRKVGVSACPVDAAEKVKKEVDFILSKKGGEGCVREFLEEKMGYDL